MLSLFMDMDIEGQVLRLCRQLLPSINEESHSVLSKDERIVFFFINKNRVLCYASISLIIRYPQFKNDKQLCTKCLYYLVRMGKILRQKLYAAEEYHDKNKL